MVKKTPNGPCPNSGTSTGIMDKNSIKKELYGGSKVKLYLKFGEDVVRRHKWDYWLRKIILEGALDSLHGCHYGRILNHDLAQSVR